MSHKFQCRSCPKTYKVLTEFIEHVKIHMIDNEKAIKSKPPKKQNLQASMLQRSIDIKLESEEVLAKYLAV